MVSGKYAIVREIAQGGMGMVYEAENLSIGRRVALKVLAASFATNPEALERFHREARAAARIGHPNILDVLDMGVSEGGTPYIVMELLRGYDLGRVVGTAPIGRAVCADIGLQLCGALGAAHAAGIIHRDLKPENVFLARRGAFFTVKVIDFGIARFLDPIGAGRRITSKGVVLGTAAYMSPEQARGDRLVDHRTDIYSAGVILYEMLSGRAPYRGASNAAVLRAIADGEPPALSAVAPWVDQGLASAVGKAMARAPEARFQTAADLAIALRHFAGSIDASPPSPAPPPRSAAESAETTTGETTRRDSISWLSRRTSVRRRWLTLLAIWVAMWLGGFVAWQKLGLPGTRTQETLSLRVTGDAADARVLLDGRLLGRLPVAVKLPPSRGHHVLRVEADGYPPSEQTIALTRPLHVIVNLARRP
ncbi:MAG: serine/threonine protein kinase [Deltaproteobacteria bacterium]|nr:serine/threonine protein kinase [Deltaproteobacteria bacterium]